MQDLTPTPEALNARLKRDGKASATLLAVVVDANLRYPYRAAARRVDNPRSDGRPPHTEYHVYRLTRVGRIERTVLNAHRVTVVGA